MMWDEKTMRERRRGSARGDNNSGR